MTLKQMQTAYGKYMEQLSAYTMQDELHPMQNYEQPTQAAIHCLVSSDEIISYDNSPNGYLRRYEFRDGAAQMMCYVFGLDLDMCRRVLMTHTAYGEYLDVKEANEKEANE